MFRQGLERWRSVFVVLSENTNLNLSTTPQEAADSHRADSASAPYSSNSKHLEDELARLDLRIRIRMLERRGARTPSPLDPFRGLVVSEEEVAALMNETDLTPHDREAQQALTTRLAEVESQIAQRLQASAENNVFLSLPRLSSLFQLGAFEQRCLTICLAPELDRKYEKLFAYLQDDVTRTKPSVDLALDLICRSEQERMTGRLAFESQAPLVKHRLLRISPAHLDDSATLVRRLLKLDDRIVNYLLGFGLMHPVLEGMAWSIPPGPDAEDAITDEAIRKRLTDFVRFNLFERSEPKRNLLFYFYGLYGSGKREMVKAVCRDLGLPLLLADAERMLEGSDRFEEAAWLLGREAVLQPAALCVENADVLLGDAAPSRSRALLESIRTYSKLAFVLGSKAWNPRGAGGDQIFVDQEFTVPASNIRKQIWQQVLAGKPVAEDVDFGALASSFQFTPGQIKDAMHRANDLAGWRSADSALIAAADIQRACRDQSTARLGTMAQKIDPYYGWEDIVLPPDQTAQLHEICSQAKYKDIVFGDWGFEKKLSLGRGLNVLFSGPAGTGKTMAAEVIAKELGLDLYKIDLSQVVSKYIGETEKNLHQIFREAASCYAILFFDEADALFGRRSEVKDAHDRYSNIEVGYLLQKMDEYDGVAILATNLRQNMDDAFVRRLQVIVDFPFPNEQYRELIWDVIFPRQSPIGEDVDFGALARDIRLAGGNIKNIALSAAFFAAADGSVIRMPHLLKAARREYQKLGWIWTHPEPGELMIS